MALKHSKSELNKEARHGKETKARVRDNLEIKGLELLSTASIYGFR
jgi:hypothetical protein